MRTISKTIILKSVSRKITSAMSVRGVARLLQVIPINLNIKILTDVGEFMKRDNKKN